MSEPTEEWLTSVHESSHVLCLWLMGRHIVMASINQRPDCVGHVTHLGWNEAGPRDVAPVQALSLLLCGEMAEVKAVGIDKLELGRSHDRERVVRFLEHVALPRDAERALVADAVRAAREFVDQNWDDIQRLAQELMDKEMLFSEQIKALGLRCIQEYESTGGAKRDRQV